MKKEVRKVTVYLRADQWLSLRAIALENAMDEGGRGDVSEILRDVVDVYLEGRQQATRTKRKRATAKS